MEKSCFLKESAESVDLASICLRRLSLPPVVSLVWRTQFVSEGTRLVLLKATGDPTPSLRSFLHASISMGVLELFQRVNTILKVPVEKATKGSYVGPVRVGTLAILNTSVVSAPNLTSISSFWLLFSCS